MRTLSTLNQEQRTFYSAVVEKLNRSLKTDQHIFVVTERRFYQMDENFQMKKKRPMDIEHVTGISLSSGVDQGIVIHCPVSWWLCVCVCVCVCVFSCRGPSPLPFQMRTLSTMNRDQRTFYSAVIEKLNRSLKTDRRIFVVIERRFHRMDENFQMKKKRPMDIEHVTGISLSSGVDQGIVIHCPVSWCLWGGGGSAFLTATLVSASMWWPLGSYSHCSLAG